MSRDELRQSLQMKMYLHQLYEYKKGVRNLILCTMTVGCANLLTSRLDNQGISYHIASVSEDKVNLFFGAKACVDALSRFVSKPLNKLTAEEDFMLGIMLGYDIMR